MRMTTDADLAAALAAERRRIVQAAIAVLRRRAELAVGFVASRELLRAAGEIELLQAEPVPDEVPA